MAIDSRQKRMSAMNHASPWRGPLVDATESSFSAGNRAAALFLYAFDSGTPPTIPGIEYLWTGDRLHWLWTGDRMHWLWTGDRMHWQGFEEQ